MAEQTIPAKTIAKILDLTIARVGQLAKDGTITREESGRYRITAVTEYIIFLRGNKVFEDDNYNKKLEKERYREKKRENDLAEEKVAPIDHLNNAILKSSAQVVPVLESLPLEMKRMNPNLTGHDIQIVKKAIAKCRNIIATTEIDLAD